MDAFGNFFISLSRFQVQIFQGFILKWIHTFLKKLLKKFGLKIYQGFWQKFVRWFSTKFLKGFLQIFPHEFLQEFFKVYLYGLRHFFEIQEIHRKYFQRFLPNVRQGFVQKFFQILRSCRNYSRDYCSIYYFQWFRQ